MNKPTAIAAALVFAVLIASALIWQRRLTADLPPRIECRDQADALTRAGEGSVPVVGTGSMAPYIPEARAESQEARARTVVAYVVLDSTPYADLTRGALCAYRPAWDTCIAALHLTAQRDAAGWIMTGLANRSYEAAWRMTPANYLGRAEVVYVWPQR